MDQDQHLRNSTILKRMQVNDLTNQILRSIQGQPQGAGRFAQPNLMPQQGPQPPITGGASTFPKTIPPFSTQTTPFIPPQPQQNNPLGGSIPPGGVIPQFPGAMPLNQSIIPKTTPGIVPPPFDPRFQT